MVSSIIYLVIGCALLKQQLLRGMRQLFWHGTKGPAKLTSLRFLLLNRRRPKLNWMSISWKVPLGFLYPYMNIRNWKINQWKTTGSEIRKKMIRFLLRWNYWSYLFPIDRFRYQRNKKKTIVLIITARWSAIEKQKDWKWRRDIVIFECPRGICPFCHATPSSGKLQRNKLYGTIVFTLSLVSYRKLCPPRGN